MRKELKIPTLIAIFILIVGVVVAAFATNFAQNIFTKASPSATPQEVKISNLTDSSFTVSWVTDEAVSGAVTYKNSNQNYSQPVLDDRVQTGSSVDKFFVHHVTLRSLKASTSYTFKIISGSSEYTDPKFVLTTPVKNTESASYPVYGTVLKTDGSGLIGGIVYLNVNNSTLLSSITKTNGGWLVPLNKARTSDLQNYITFNKTGDLINIFVQAGKSQIAQAKTVTGNDNPVPNITIGGNFDFSKKENAPVPETSTPTPTVAEESTVTASVTPTPTKMTTFDNLKDKNSEGASIVVPAQNSSLTDSKPTFEGTAEPGQVIKITVESENKYTASVVASENGDWNWTPPGNLEPGSHTVTMVVKDKNGIEKTVQRKFIVLASGTSVSESATPSATMTLTPTLTPEITASPSPIYVAGNFGPTFSVLLLAFGILLVSSFIYLISR